MAGVTNRNSYFQLDRLVSRQKPQPHRSNAYHVRLRVGLPLKISIMTIILAMHETRQADGWPHVCRY